jgi:hypothetical protein
MIECGLLGAVLGGVAFIASFENMVKIEAALGEKPDAVRRLGALAAALARSASGWQKIRSGSPSGFACPMLNPSACWRWNIGGA